jgi:hypothetical protein
MQEVWEQNSLYLEPLCTSGNTLQVFCFDVKINNKEGCKLTMEYCIHSTCRFYHVLFNFTLFFRRENVLFWQKNLLYFSSFSLLLSLFRTKLHLAAHCEVLMLTGLHVFSNTPKRLQYSSALKLEVVCFCETLFPTDESTRSQNSEQHSHSHLCEDLKSHIPIYYFQLLIHYEHLYLCTADKILSIRGQAHTCM